MAAIYGAVAVTDTKLLATAALLRSHSQSIDSRGGKQSRLSAGEGGYACLVPIPRFLKGRGAKEPAVSVDDPRLEGWETVSAFADQKTALAWRDQLRAMGVDASCVADRPPDRFGRGDIYLVVPSEQWSRASEIVENLD